MLKTHKSLYNKPDGVFGRHRHNYLGEAEVHITGRRGRKKATATLRKRKKRRAAIEPKIGHLKSDNRMGRNFLKGQSGDRINALLAGIGANLRKLLAAFWPALWEGRANYADRLLLAFLLPTPRPAAAA